MPKPVRSPPPLAEMNEEYIKPDEYNAVKAWLAAYPSPADFIDYFTVKLKTLRQESDKTLQLVDSYKESAEKVLGLLDTLKGRDEDAFRLQQNLSDAQIALYEERENYLKLIAENEQLKLENENYRRRFHTSLLLSGTKEEDVAHFLQRHPRANEITDEMIKLREEIRICSVGKGNEFQMLDPAILQKKVMILEEQLKETKSVHQTKLHYLKKSMKLTKREYSARIQQMDLRLITTVDQLKEKTSLLHRSLVENLELQKKILVNETQWVEERKRFFHGQSHSSGPVPKDKQPVPGGSQDPNKEEFSDQGAVIKRLQRNYSRLEGEIMDKENLVLEYQMQALRLDKQLHRLRGETEEYKKAYDDQIKKVLERNTILKKRICDIDSRRKLEGAGFRTDVQNIKTLLSLIDKKLQELTRPRASGMKEKRAPVPVRLSVSARAIGIPTVPPIEAPNVTRRPTRLHSAPALGIDKSPPRVHRHRHARGGGRVSKSRSKANQVSKDDPPPSTACAKPVKEHVSPRQISSAALAKLLRVAQEKVKILDDLLKKTLKSQN